uniref:DUF6512 family protein n=1 Tax=Agathobacter sp. TaxID=2021311 RepID=UPI004056DCB1
MSNKTRLILCYVFVAVLGTLLHFAYEFSGKNPVVGLFAPINESTWEHLKLLFTPMLVLTLWDLLTAYRKSPRFLPARTVGIISGLLFIIAAFYTINGIIGSIIDWINIVIFLLSVLVVFWVEKKLYGGKICCCPKYFNATFAIIVLIILILLFVVFTVSPPDIGLFRVP